MRDAFDVPPKKLMLVPIGFEVEPQDMGEGGSRESFCLHVSTLYQPRKNVLRLIGAAKKYGFRLVLAGAHGTQSDFEPIQKAIGDAPNIEIKGFLSEEELRNLYLRAKVFALPSIEEGVGIVALNAGVLGANIVITDRGGPKEYFGDKAQIVNPMDGDAIGHAVMKALDDNNTQPGLSRELLQKYSTTAISSMLLKSYQEAASV